MLSDSQSKVQFEMIHYVQLTMLITKSQLIALCRFGKCQRSLSTAHFSLFEYKI